VRLDTKAELDIARERLRRRDPELLASFILSLAQDSGPVGEQVRTFILGDDVVKATESLRERIRALEGLSESSHRHSLGQDIGQRLQFILEAIESLVLPAEPHRAFALLAELFESDGRAMEACGEHHWAVECAFERAAAMMNEASKEMPVAEVVATVTRLMAVDSYGLREGLGTVLALRTEAR
jgi:hypothetical protein